MAKIFVSRKFPGTHLDRLEKSGNEVNVCEFDRPLEAEEFLERARGMDAVLSFLTDKINGEVIDAIGNQVKIFSNYAVGFDNINIKEASQRKVLISNTPCDEVNEAVAECAVALMFSLARRIVEADESTKRGSYRGWEPHIFLGKALRGKTLGILGLGRIGTMVAKKVDGFEMRVLYNKRSPDPDAEREYKVEYADIERLFRESDVITIHLPLTDQTREMINADAISKMKPGVIIINTARGAIVDEHALVDGLRDGKIGGAGLDVFETEPNINPELIGMENVALTPHIASATYEARNKMGELAVDAILKTLSGEKPDNLVNPEIWEERRK